MFTALKILFKINSVVIQVMLSAKVKIQKSQQYAGFLGLKQD